MPERICADRGQSRCDRKTIPANPATRTTVLVLRGLIDEHQIKQLSPYFSEDCSLSLTLKLVAAIPSVACARGSLRAISALLRRSSSRSAGSSQRSSTRGLLATTPSLHVPDQRLPVLSVVAGYAKPDRLAILDCEAPLASLHQNGHGRKLAASKLPAAFGQTQLKRRHSNFWSIEDAGHRNKACPLRQCRPSRRLRWVVSEGTPHAVRFARMTAIRAAPVPFPPPTHIPARCTEGKGRFGGELGVGEAVAAPDTSRLVGGLQGKRHAGATTTPPPPPAPSLLSLEPARE